MTEQNGGAERSTPLHLKAEGRGSRGASLFTVRIYEAVLNADDEGLKVAQIHDRLKDDPAFRTDTAADRGRSLSKAGSTSSSCPIDIEKAGLERVRRRVKNLYATGVLRSHNDDPGGKHGGAHYTAGRAPKGYRPKFKRQNPYGWFDIDVRAASRASERQRDRIVLLQSAKAVLAKNSNARTLKPLLAEAVRLLEEGS